MKEKYLLEKYKLPYYIKGKSFSDAAKSISKRFEGRNDSVSLKTKKELLDRLKMAQEEIRSQKEDQIEGVNHGTNEALLGGLMDALGGHKDIMNAENPIEAAQVGVEDFASEGLEGAMTGLQVGGPIGAAIGGAAGLVSAGVGALTGQQAARKADRTLTRKASNQANEKYEMGGTVDPDPLTVKDKEILRKDNPLDLKIAASTEGDELMDRLFVKKTPVEKAIVDLGKYKDVGYFDFDPSDPTGTTLMRGKRQIHNDDAVKRQFGNIQKLNPGLELKYKNEFKYGGPIKMDLTDTNKYSWGGDALRNIKDFVTNIFSKKEGLTQPTLDPIKGENMRPIAKGLDFVAPKRGEFEFQAETPLTRAPLYEKPSMKDQLKEYLGSDEFKGGFNNLLRTAPAIGNAIQLANLEPADPIRLDRMDFTYKPNYTDEAAYTNRINNTIGNLTEGIQDSSAGDIGAIRTNLLAGYLKKNQMLGEAARQAHIDNRAEDKTAAEYAFNKGRLNLRQSNLEQDMNDANEGAFTTAKSQLGSALANDAGNIGLERQRMDYARRMGLLYDSNGKYIGRYDKGTGRFISADEEPEPTEG